MGLGLTDVEVEFPIGVDAHSFDDEQWFSEQEPSSGGCVEDEQ